MNLEAAALLQPRISVRQPRLCRASHRSLSMEEMRPLPADLREEAHLMELESMGFTIVHGAIPPDLLRRLKVCHAQACARIREAKPEADWSWESDNPCGPSSHY